MSDKKRMRLDEIKYVWGDKYPDVRWLIYQLELAWDEDETPQLIKEIDHLCNQLSIADDMIVSIQNTLEQANNKETELKEKLAIAVEVLECIPREGGDVAFQAVREALAKLKGTKE